MFQFKELDSMKRTIKGWQGCSEVACKVIILMWVSVVVVVMVVVVLVVLMVVIVMRNLMKCTGKACSEEKAGKVVQLVQILVHPYNNIYIFMDDV